MLQDEFNMFKFKFQLYCFTLYCNYFYVFCCIKQFEEDLTKKNNKVKNVEIKKVEDIKNKLEEKKDEIKKIDEIKKVVKEEEEIEKPIEENKSIDNDDKNDKEHIEKPIEENIKEFIEKPVESIIKDTVNIEKINNINKNIKETLDTLKFPIINENLEIYKNIFIEIIKKCRGKVLFLRNKSIFTELENIKSYSDKYVKIENFFDIVDNISENNFKLNGNEVDIKFFIDEKNVNTNEILIIKDPVYNFIYSVRCDINVINENVFLDENPKKLYLKNDGFKEKYLYKNKLYFYLNEKEDEKNEEKLQPTKYMIFFRYLLSLLDESDILCSKIENNKKDKFFIKNKMEMNVLTSIGTNENNPIKIKNNIKIAEGIKK